MTKTILIAFAVLAFAFAGQIAEAGCRTTSVCVLRFGQQSCAAQTVCAVPRVRVCSFATRCYPRRVCSVSAAGSLCVTRDVCQREEVCS
jgi:hypothetical protein